MKDNEFAVNKYERYLKKCAAYYMAKTELYNRTLTDKRMADDQTQADVYSGDLYEHAVHYANLLKDYVIERIGMVGWDAMQEIIKECPYTSQGWVELYKGYGDI